MTTIEEKKPFMVNYVEETVLRDMIAWYSRVLRNIWEPKLNDKKTSEEEKTAIRGIFERFDKTKLGERPT